MDEREREVGILHCTKKKKKSHHDALGTDFQSKALGLWKLAPEGRQHCRYFFLVPDVKT